MFDILKLRLIVTHFCQTLVYKTPNQILLFQTLKPWEFEFDFCLDTTTVEWENVVVVFTTCETDPLMRHLVVTDLVFMVFSWRYSNTKRKTVDLRFSVRANES